MYGPPSAIHIDIQIPIFWCCCVSANIHENKECEKHCFMKPNKLMVSLAAVFFRKQELKCLPSY